MNRHIIRQNFNEFVRDKFHFINSVFLGISAENISNRSVLNFASHVKSCLEKGMAPDEIVKTFFPKGASKDTISEGLLSIIKFIEREVVIFDAVEDGAFEKINDLNGSNSLHYVISDLTAQGRSEELIACIKDICVRLVLTAHPTQFYPGTVLGIITDLNTAIRSNDLSGINGLLSQLFHTSLFNKQKPTPYDEAVSSIWYLENIFYDAVLAIHDIIEETLPDDEPYNVNPGLVQLGFWPGGDRDGNPFVTAEVTKQVANRLRSAILQKYHGEIYRLRRKLTFAPFFEELRAIELSLYRSMNSEEEPEISAEELLQSLKSVKARQQEDFKGLYVRETKRLINIISIFKYHFASIDIRQDSRVHKRVLTEILRVLGAEEAYGRLSGCAKSDFVFELKALTDIVSFSQEAEETLRCIREIKNIQRLNGEAGCCRYVISNCSSEDDVLDLIALFILAGWDSRNISVDIIPLFETIEDLGRCGDVLSALYGDMHYKAVLKKRNDRQTVMLGFSDGTKDGGYFTANWAIYKAKEDLTRVSRAAGVQIVFFDGRGGPAARGGGKTHNHYASHSKDIDNREMQLTVQGQTVSSNFGTVLSAQYNLEQLISAGIKSKLYPAYREDLSKDDRKLMGDISAISRQAYTDLKNNACFIPYLLNKTSLPYYGMSNVGSRPDSRKDTGGFSLNDLRAIPFVGSWTLNKQNIPAFYGLGFALESLRGRADIKGLYRRSLFFRTLVQNSIMVLKKTDFRLTAHIGQEAEYTSLWNMLFREYERAVHELLDVSEADSLMQDNPKDRLSVEMREDIIKPLAVIHQYALMKEGEKGKKRNEDYSRMIVRSSYGIINAGRNSV